MTNEHTCTSSGRRKTSTPTGSWVACQVLPILTKKVHMGAKELQMTLHVIPCVIETLIKVISK
jgi:hypothetical protein